MDVVIKMVVIAAVILTAAGIVLFMLTGEAGNYKSFLNNQSNQSNCRVLLEQGQCSEHNLCNWNERSCWRENPREVEGSECNEFSNNGNFCTNKLVNCEFETRGPVSICSPK